MLINVVQTDQLRDLARMAHQAQRLSPSFHHPFEKAPWKKALGLDQNNKKLVHGLCVSVHCILDRLDLPRAASRPRGVAPRASSRSWAAASCCASEGSRRIWWCWRLARSEISVVCGNQPETDRRGWVTKPQVLKSPCFFDFPDSRATHVGTFRLFGPQPFL